MSEKWIVSPDLNSKQKWIGNRSNLSMAVGPSKYVEQIVSDLNELATAKKAQEWVDKYATDILTVNCHDKVKDRAWEALKELRQLTTKRE